MANKPAYWVWEIFSLSLAIIAGIFILWNEPASKLPEEWIRRIDAIGTWLQLVGAIILSFEILRGPLIKRQLQDYQEANQELTEQFAKSLKATDNEDKIAQINHVVTERIILNKTYFSVLNFEVTSRVAYLIGLAIVVAGYVIQLGIK